MTRSRPPSRPSWFSRLKQWLRQVWRRLTGEQAAQTPDVAEPVQPTEATETEQAPAVPVDPIEPTTGQPPVAEATPTGPTQAPEPEAPVRPDTPKTPASPVRPAAPTPPLIKSRVLSSTGKASSPDGHLRVQPWMPPSRSYQLLRPATPAPDMKLLVLIHGCKQDADGFAQATRAQQLVATGQWAVLLPDQSKAANLYRCWNWFDGNCMQGRGEVAIVLAAIAQARQTLGLGDARSFVAGLSSGAALAAALVANRPDQFAGAAFFAGLPMGATKSPMHARKVMANGPERDVTTDLPAFGPLPALIVQGDKDETVNPAHADELIRQMLAINERIAPGDPLPAADEQFVTPAGSDGTHERHAVERSRFGPCERIIVRGMGHAWSGGDSAWRWFDASGPDGLDLITDFFARSEADSVQPVVGVGPETAATNSL